MTIIRRKMMKIETNKEMKRRTKRIKRNVMGIGRSGRKRLKRKEKRI